MAILAAIDRGDQTTEVLEHAADLADAYGEELHALHVMTQSEFVELETTSVNDTGEPLEMSRVREVAADLASDAAEDAGLRSYKAVGRVGDTSQEILHYAADIDANYVVIGGKKRSPTGKAIFGSVTQSTLLNADRPVVVIMTSE